MMPSFNRPKVLKRQIDSMAAGQVPSLAEIIVIWGSPEVQGAVPDYLLNDPSWTVPVTYVMSPGRDLNSRFIPPVTLQTRCIYAADDDLFLPASAVEFGFHAWRMSNAPLVGYSSRMVKKGKNGEWLYNYKDKKGAYSLILTNHAFMDVALLDAYNSPPNAKPRDIVQTRLNCEDILMNFIGTGIYRLPPVLVYAAGGDIIHHQIKGVGISIQAGHYDERSECVQEFSHLWG